jgi:major vault protein
LAEIEITHAKEMSAIESRKFEEMINSIGQETLIAISNAGPEAQVFDRKLFEG